MVDGDADTGENRRLHLVRSWWKHLGAKEAVVYERLGWTVTRFYQVLNALIDSLAALAHDL